MEYGEQCAIMAGITMMQELCADNWDIWVKVISFIHCEIIVDRAYVTCVPIHCRVIFVVQLYVAILFKNGDCSVIMFTLCRPIGKVG